MTTKKNLASHKLGIEWHTLPKSFQDAITITRNLEKRYLWIDSLCIVQDDKNDWDREAGKMAAIYSESWLTIAATAASDSTKGCFPAEDQRMLSQAEIIELPNGDHPQVYARKLPGGVHQSGLSLYYPQPLEDRGWTFQEQLLARRLVHMCGEEMIFECPSQKKCECTPFRHNSTEGSGTFKHHFNDIIYHDLQHPSIFLEAWDMILHRYLLRRLTFQKDKVLAISGVQKKMMSTRLSLGKCVAGMWEAWFCAGLLWFAEPVWTDPTKYPSGRDRSSYAAPTWSWASLNGSWAYGRVPIERSFPTQLKEASWHLPPGTKSDIKTPWVTLSGPVITARIEYNRSQADKEDGANFKAQKPEVFRVDEPATEFGATADVDTILDRDQDPLMPGDPVLLMHIQIDQHIFQEDKCTCRGLIVKPVGKHESSLTSSLQNLTLPSADGREASEIFERVGIFSTTVDWFDSAETQSLTLV